MSSPAKFVYNVDSHQYTYPDSDGTIATQEWVGAEGFISSSENETIAGDWVFTGNFSVGDGASGTGFWTDNENHVSWTGDWQNSRNGTTINVDDEDQVVEVNALNGINTNSVNNIGGNWSINTDGSASFGSTPFIYWTEYGQATISPIGMASGLTTSSYTTKVGDISFKNNSTYLDIDDEYNLFRFISTNGPDSYPATKAKIYGNNGSFWFDGGAITSDGSGNVTASSFIKSGGTSLEVLMADGSTSTLPSGFNPDVNETITGYWVFEGGFYVGSPTTESGIYKTSGAISIGDVAFNGNGTKLEVTDYTREFGFWTSSDGIADPILVASISGVDGKVSFDNSAFRSDGSGNVTASSFTGSDGAIASQAWVDGQGYGYGTSNYNPSFTDEGGGTIYSSYWGINGENGQIEFDAGAITSNGYGALSAYALTINSDVDNSSASLSTTSLQFSFSDDGGGSTTSMYSANNVGISYTDDYGETSYTSLDYAAVSGGYVAECVTQSSWSVSSSGISLSNFGSTFFNVDGAGNIEALSINLYAGQIYSDLFGNFYTKQIINTDGNWSIGDGGSVSFDGGQFSSDGTGCVAVSGIATTSANVGILASPNVDNYSTVIGDVNYDNYGTTLWVNDANRAVYIGNYVDNEPFAIIHADNGAVSFDNGAFNTDGYGNVNVNSLSSYEGVSFDNGAIYTDGSGSLTGDNFYFNRDGSGNFNSLWSWDNSGNLTVQSINNGGGFSLPNDGTGFLANGNVSWDGSGNVTATSFTPSVFTNTTMAAIPSPQVGQIVYNSDLETLCFYTGDGWKAVTSSFP